MKLMKESFGKSYYPERTFAYIRHVGPYAGDTALFQRLFGEVMEWMQRESLFTPNTETITIYHDNPDSTPPEKQRISVGFTVPEKTRGEGDIQIMKIPPGHYATGRFEIGPSEYPQAWEAMFDYICDEAFTIYDGLMYESYRSDPRNHPEGKHLVDICIAVR